MSIENETSYWNSDGETKARLALRAMRRGVMKAFLNGEAYDPDGKGYAYWKAQEEAEKAAQEKPTK